jgi:hypothetical protein
VPFFSDALQKCGVSSDTTMDRRERWRTPLAMNVARHTILDDRALMGPFGPAQHGLDSFFIHR